LALSPPRKIPFIVSVILGANQDGLQWLKMFYGHNFSLLFAAGLWYFPLSLDDLFGKPLSHGDALDRHIPAQSEFNKHVLVWRRVCMRFIGFGLVID